MFTTRNIVIAAVLVIGLIVMARFVRNAQRIEPFFTTK